MSVLPQPPAQKFMFNRSFDGMVPEVAAPKEPPPPTYSQAELDAARIAGEQQGYQAGEQAAQESLQARLCALTEQLAQNIEQLLSAQQAQQDKQEGDIAAIAVAIARKLLPDAAAEQALVGISAMVAAVCKDMTREPRLVVRVHDSLLDPLRQQLDSLTQRAAYAGKIVLLADDALLPADCKIEWADGGIERDSASLWQQIDSAVQRAHGIAEITTHAPSPSAQE